MEQKFITLAKQYESLQEEIGKIRDELTKTMLEIGLDKYVQDPETLTVYKVIKPQGTFVYFKEIDYKRTALEGEKGGTVLSKVEAQGAGFILKK